MSPRRVDPLELREAAMWRSSFERRPSLLDFLGVRVGLAGALAVSKLLRPALVEVRGCVLLRERFEQANFDRWWAELDGNRPAVESVINHVHLWDLFDPDPGDAMVEDALIELAHDIAASWRCFLPEQYSDRRFQVQVATELGADYGPTVSFSSETAGESR